MEFCGFKKNKIKLTALSFGFGIVCNYSYASTSLMVSGHAGVVGQYVSGMPPMNKNYNAIRVPVGLTLEASPSDNLNLYLGLDYAYNNYPSVPTLLGQTYTTSTTNPSGQYTPVPFTNTVNSENGATPYGQKTDTPTLTTAYFTYQTPMGLLKAGRMPRNWGLGIWYNDEWRPTGGTISTSDAIAFTTDLTLFDATVYYEKFGEGIGGTSANGAAVAYTIEARLKTDPADIPSTGVSREMGIIYSKFENGQSDTSLNIIDAYGKFYVSRFFIGTEILYPTGHSRNPNYQSLGGAPSCSFTPSSGSTDVTKTCSPQDFSALAALFKLKFQLEEGDNSSLAATETAQKLVGTAERQTSSVVGLLAGYVSGGANQFNSPTPTDNVQSGNKIKAMMINPNIQPAFLMFNNAMPPVNGMPTGALTNTSFVKLDYTYETSNFGAIGPQIVWARLDKRNANYNATNALCSAPQSLDTTKSVNHLCVGGTSNLGVEIDASYHYTTLDRLNVGVDVGYWFVGDAWKIYGKSSPVSTYGVRISAGTEF